MKTKSFFILLLMATMCFYGCTTKYVYVVSYDDTVTPEETDQNNSDVSPGDNSGDISEDYDIYDYEYFNEQGDGTRENPYTATQAIEIMNKNTYETDKGYYVKGIVYGTVDVRQFLYGCRVSYNISYNGRYNISTSLYVYYGFGLGGECFTSEDDIHAGDKVILYGRFSYSYNGATIIQGKLCYLNGKVADVDEQEYEYYAEPGNGTKESPYSVSQTIEMIINGTYDSDKSCFVKGIDTGECNTISSWGGSDYYISENGDHGYCLFVNNGYGFGGGNINTFPYLLKGDKVVVYGKLAGDYNRPEILDSQIYYLNGVTADID